MENATAIIHTEASYILGVPEASLRYTLKIGNESQKRADGYATEITFDVSGAYPPDYLVIIVAVCVAVPCGLGVVAAWYLFYYRMKMKALTKDCM